jgi:hypothetical protein
MAKQPVTITLTEPVKFGSETIETITIQPVKGKHLRKLPADPDVGDMLVLAAKLAGQPDQVFDEMDAEDIMQVTEVIEGFLPNSPATGKNRSR